MGVGAGAGGGGGGAGAGATTVAAVTVIAEVLLFPSAVEVMVALPTATPVTRPLLLTAATALLELAQVTEWAVTGLPATSVNESVSCNVLPCCTEPDAGEIAMLFTGPEATEKVDFPDFPLAVAVMVAWPTWAPVATPVDDTLTIEASDVDHVTVCPETVLPEMS